MTKISVFEEFEKKLEDDLTCFLDSDKWISAGNIGSTKIERIHIENQPIGAVKGTLLYPCNDEVSLADFKPVLESPFCRKFWDEVFETGRVIDSIKEDGEKMYFCKLAYSTTKAVWPVSPRDFAVMVKSHLEQNRYLYVAKSIPQDLYSHNSNIPKITKNFVRAELGLAAWVIEKLDSNVKITYIMLTNPLGSIPKVFLQNLYIQFPKSINVVYNFIKEKGFPPHILRHSKNIHLTQQVQSDIKKFQAFFINKSQKNEESFIEIRLEYKRWYKKKSKISFEIINCNQIIKSFYSNDTNYSVVIKILCALKEEKFTLQLKESTLADTFSLFINETEIEKKSNKINN